LLNIKKENMKNKTLMIKVLLCAMTISITAAQAQNNPPVRSSTTRTRSSSSDNWMNVQSDSANDPNKSITMYKNGDVYKIKVTNEKITEMYIDDKKVPESDFPKYATMVKEILEQVKRDEEQAARDREQAERDRKQADKDRQQAERDRQRAELDRAQAEKDRQQADRDRERAVQDRAQADKNREQVQRDRAQAERDRAQADKDREQAGRDRQRADQDRAQAERDRQRADKDRAQADRDREQANRDREQAGRDRVQAEKDRAQAEIDRKRAEEDRKKMAAFFEDLVKENIVGSKEEVRIVELSDDSFIVNDKKQSAELHQKFKSKYLSGSGSRMRYSNQNGNRHFSIHNE
jgi:phage-related minor tail protein